MDFSNRRRMRNMVVDTGQAAKQTNTHTSYTPTSFFYLNIIKVIIIYHRKKKILILILYDPKKKGMDAVFREYPCNLLAFFFYIYFNLIN